VIPRRFAANVSMLFTERPFVERFGAAARAGFHAVEFWWPGGEELDDVVAAVREAGLQVVLFNFDAGDMAAGDRGLLNDPAREAQFREHVPRALELAGTLDCRLLNALVGLELPGTPRQEQLARAQANVRFAARALAPHGMQVLVEAINTHDNGPYLLHRTEQASAFAAAVGEPNVALQYDVFHMQRMEGDLTATLRRHVHEIAHVQIADVPGRAEPGTGEIRFPHLFDVLDELGYAGHVGLEYRPATARTEESLGWCAAEALRSQHLRDVVEADLDVFCEQQLDEEANRMAAFPPRQRDEFMAHWARILGDERGLKKTIVVGGHVAGNVVSFEQSGRWEVGYWIGKAYWGLGVATRALSEFLRHERARPLFAHVAKHNVGSRRVLEKCGFAPCGEDRVSFAGGELEELILRLDAAAAPVS
jgi:hydroxypyruvate isomerase